MQKTTFIILSKSGIIRKGISSVINQVENTLVYDELDKAEDLNLTTPYHIPDFLIVDFDSIPKENMKHVDNFTKKFSVEVIAYCIGNEEKNIHSKCKACIGQYEAEENIKQKLLVCINGSDGNNQDSLKNVFLSDREKNVLELVAKGLTNKEIADKLFISLHTVITHRKNITKKLGIKTVSGLTVYAILNNIIEMKDIEQK